MLEIIIATDEKGGFGKDGKIPWYYPEDLKHFKATTQGHVCLMGRNTYEDMLEMRRERDAKKGNANTEIEEILPNRLSFVITSSDTLDTPGATKAKSIAHAINLLPFADTRRVFVIGGERMYIEALPNTAIVHQTVVPGDYDCDRFFPLSALDGKFTSGSFHEEGELKFYTFVRIE